MQILSFDGKSLALDEKSLALEDNSLTSVENLIDTVSSTDLLDLPIIGNVSAGVPIEAISQTGNYVQVPADIFKERPTYLLRVKGDSMEEAGILDGDLIAVKKTDTAEEGAFIVARIGNEVTVKELQVENGRPVLIPHNKNYEPMFVAPEEFVVEGVFVGLLRNRRYH